MAAIGSFITWLITDQYYASKLIDVQFKLEELKIRWQFLRSDYQRLQAEYDRLESLLGGTSKTSKPIQSPIEYAYKTLGLPMGASPQEVKNKYRMLIKKYHPDVNKRKGAATRFREVIEAYQILVKDK